MNEQSKPRGTLTLQTVAMPCDTNANGDIFGGWLVSNMDMACGIAARNRARSRAVTRAINELEFISPVNVGDTVCCYAELIKTGRTSMQFRIEVWKLTFEYGETPIKAAAGLFTFVAIDDEGKPCLIDR